MTTTSTKATTAKKTPAKATTAKKTPAKATAAKKTPAKTTTAKKTPAKTTTAKKTPAKTTTAKKAETVAPVSNDVAISPSVQSTAITVSSVNDSLSSVLTPALSHPVSVAVGNTVASTVEGFNQIWTHEAEYKTGLQFATLCKDAFVAIVLPILNLLWLALGDRLPIFAEARDTCMVYCPKKPSIQLDFACVRFCGWKQR